MQRSTEWILRGIVLATCVGLSTRFLAGYSPRAEAFAFWVLIVGVSGWLLIAILRLTLSVLYFGKGRYSVLIFALDEQSRLLLVRHPYHKRLIPPGGRLRVFELPHAAVSRVLAEEANLKTFSFHPAFHRQIEGYSDTVTILPQPYSVQREDRRQRGFVRFHYAFVYVVIAQAADLGSPPEGYQPRWCGKEQVTNMVAPDRPFDDVVKRYLDIISELPT